MKVKADISFNAEKLSEAYFNLMANHSATLYNNIKNGNRFGWALTSRTGKMNDIHGRRYRSYDHETEFSIPTAAFSGYFADILMELSGILGPIYRARIIGIDGFREIKPHHDGHDGTQFLRYHIPIIPNPACTFTAEDHEFVMEQAGGLYLFKGWKTHSVINESGQRVHLMFSSYRDIREITGADIGTEKGITDKAALVN